MAAVNIQLKPPGDAMRDALINARRLNRHLTDLVAHFTRIGDAVGLSKIQQAEMDLAGSCANMAVAFTALKSARGREMRRSMAIHQLIGAVRDSSDDQG